MRDLSELYLRNSGPVLSAESVRTFEEYFQVILPPSYLRFLSNANGGEPMLDCTFDYTTVFGELVESADQVKEFGFLTDDQASWGGVWRNTAFLRSIFAALARNTRVVWIGSSAEGGLIYLDFTIFQPSVYILYRECDETTPQIAISFNAFTESLHPRS